MRRTTPSPARSSAGTSTTATDRCGRGSTASSATPRSTTCAGGASAASRCRRSRRSARSRPAARGASPSTRPTAVVDRDLVEGALADLKPDARAALVLRHYYGYDYAEIAGFLRTSPGNVGSILSRAHATLRTRLDRRPRRADDAGRRRTEPLR